MEDGRDRIVRTSQNGTGELAQDGKDRTLDRIAGTRRLEKKDCQHRTDRTGPDQNIVGRTGKRDTAGETGDRRRDSWGQESWNRTAGTGHLEQDR